MATLNALLEATGLQSLQSVLEEEELTPSLLASMGNNLLPMLRELGVTERDAETLAAHLSGGRPKAQANGFKTWQDLRPPPETTPPARDAPAPPPILEASYVNLGHRTDRRAMMEEKLRGAGLDAERFEAVTGEAATDDEVGRVWDTALNARFDRNCRSEPRLPMSDGERGCCASHVRLWRRAASTDRPLLVLEDDVEFETGAAGAASRLVAAVHAALQPDERKLVLYLGAEVSEWRDSPGMCAQRAAWAARSAVPGVALREARWAWQTHAYVIWPAAARVLLAGLPADAPVDVYLSRHFHERRVAALVAQPMLATQTDPYRGGDVPHSSLAERERIGFYDAANGRGAASATAAT